MSELHSLTSIAARSKLTLIDRLSGCPIYSASDQWVIDQLAHQEGTSVALTPADFEACCEDTETETILVPKNTFGAVMVRRILQRTGVIKDIVMENNHGHE
jgi:hypothetical protein